MTFPIAADEPEIATIGAATFLSVSGQGPPGTDDFYARKAELGAAVSAVGGLIARPYPPKLGGGHQAIRTECRPQFTASTGPSGRFGRF